MELVEIDGPNNIHNCELPRLASDQGETYRLIVCDHNINIDIGLRLAASSLDQAIPTGCGQLISDRVNIGLLIRRVFVKGVTPDVDSLQPLEDFLSRCILRIVTVEETAGHRQERSIQRNGYGL